MKRQPRILPYLLILPTLGFVCLFTLLPLGNSIVGSLFMQKLNIPKFHDPVFAGTTNFTRLFADETFRNAALNTAYYVLVSVPASLVLAFGLALLLSGKFRGQTAFRLIVFHPAILPMVSAATLWLFFMTPDYGILNQILHWFGYSGPQNWTGNPGLALPALILVGVWKQTGFYMLFLLAGLQGLDRSVMDAAKIDGAIGLRLMGAVILPLIRRSVLFTSTLAFISAFQTADHVFVMTRGGPSDSSNILLYLLWQLRFEQMDIGAAHALTVVLVAVLLVFTVSNFLVSERHEA